MSGKAVGQRGEVPIGHFSFLHRGVGGRVPLLGFEEVKILGAEILLRDEAMSGYVASQEMLALSKLYPTLRDGMV